MDGVVCSFAFARDWLWGLQKRGFSRLQVHVSFAVMAGRGRGVASFTFNIEALGIGRGSMPDARVGPSPLFPVSSEDIQALHN